MIGVAAAAAGSVSGRQCSKWINIIDSDFFGWLLHGFRFAAPRGTFVVVSISGNLENVYQKLCQHGGVPPECVVFGTSYCKLRLAIFFKCVACAGVFQFYKKLIFCFKFHHSCCRNVWYSIAVGRVAAVP